MCEAKQTQLNYFFFPFTTNYRSISGCFLLGKLKACNTNILETLCLRLGLKNFCNNNSLVVFAWHIDSSFGIKKTCHPY